MAPLSAARPEMSDSYLSPTPRRSFRLALDQLDRVTVVKLEGDLDLASAPELKASLTDALREGSGRLVLDFSGVAFADSTALSVLIGVQRRLGPDDRLAIATARPDVLRVLEVSGLAGAFRIFPTRDTALAYVENRPGDHGPQAACPPLTADAALTVGIASTAMPFAQSDEDQVERWLRVLRRHGEAGALLASLGVSEGPLRDATEEATAGPPRDADPIAAVSEHAARIASQRLAARIATTDVLLAVMHVYGATFERVLTAHGGDIDELASLVAETHAAAAA
jgi:anti-sigma B factor antagonist